MGSTLSVQNGTNDTWSIKVGPDMKALMVSTIVLGIVASIGTAGAASGLLAGMEVAVAGSVITATTVVGAADAISVTNVAVDLITHMNESFSQEGYTNVNPHSEWKSGKKSLSLWQQCEALRSRRDGDDVIVERLWMRPIFSGPTIDSDNGHDIQSYINQNGVEEISRIHLVVKTEN